MNTTVVSTPMAGSYPTVMVMWLGSLDVRHPWVVVTTTSTPCRLTTRVLTTRVVIAEYSIGGRESCWSVDVSSCCWCVCALAEDNNDSSLFGLAGLFKDQFGAGVIEAGK